MHRSRTLWSSLSLSVLTALSLTTSAFAGAQVPIKGAFATQFAIIGVEFPIPNLPVPKVTLMVQGAGQMSHLGLTACLSEDETLDFTQGGLLTGTLTFTAANGDKLVARMNGFGWPVPEEDTVYFSGALTFDGGTGRFAKATGQAVFEGGASPIAGPTGDGWFSLQGTVSSPGASKK